MIISQGLKTVLSSNPSLLGLVGNYLSYRQAGRELALEEKRIDCAFQLESQRISAEVEAHMYELASLRQQSEHHYQQIGADSRMEYESSRERASQRFELIRVLATPGLPHTEKAMLLELIKELNQLDKVAMEKSMERLRLKPDVTLDRRHLATLESEPNLVKR
tara:strand:+ start:404 stop:892 length:489 start_codon:yes stop_codon:yes gene_type:complete